jgi:hypothetical protein
VGVLLPLDNEKEREQTIHFLRNLSKTSAEDGPLAISFGAQSMYDEENGEIIFQPANWDICAVQHPPFQFKLKDFDTEALPMGSTHRCSSLKKRGLRCKRLTFHEFCTCWQHRHCCKK